MDVYTNAARLKKQEIEFERTVDGRRVELKAKVARVFKSAKRSQLFCDFYKPDGDDCYEKFGFDWPKEKEMLELCVQHNIEPKDLILEKVNWIKDSCGFAMIAFEFKGGICSPQFACDKVDGDSYLTSVVDTNKTSKHIRLRVAEDKFVEQLEFVTKKPHTEADRVMHAYCCKKGTGADQYFDIPEGHRIVGVYGLTKTNKYVNTEYWPDGIRKWDTIRGIGFVTMNLNA
jgi:hypothetical protein